MAQKMANNIIDIIDTKDPGIVVKETSIRLSDEKFKSALSRTHEKAQSDASEIKLRKHFSVFLSIAGTLFLSLITATFGAIGKISAERVTDIAWFLCIVSAIWGFILLGMLVSEKMKTDMTLRDKAVNEIFEEYVSKE